MTNELRALVERWRGYVNSREAYPDVVSGGHPEGLIPDDLPS